MDTLLEIVRRINMDLTNGDYLHTIDETRLSTHITDIVEETYWNIINGRDWPHLYEFFQFTESDATTPTHMTIPNTVMDLQYVKYNVRTSTDTKDKYREIEFLWPKQFMDIVDRRDSSDSSVDVVTDSSGISMNIYNDRAPNYYTSLGDETAVFDAYDSDVETYLATNKTQVYGKIKPTFTREDSYEIDLPTDSLSYLISKAKAASYTLVVGQQNPDAEREAITQRRRQSQEAQKINNGITYPNYGRRSKK